MLPSTNKPSGGQRFVLPSLLGVEVRKRVAVMSESEHDSPSIADLFEKLR